MSSSAKQQQIELPRGISGSRTSCEENTARPRPIAWCLTEEEFALFFGHIDGRVSFGRNEVSCFISPELPLDEWKSRLLECQPEVIIGAWAMPEISDEVLAGCPSLKYFCYVCGSVRQKISRAFIEEGGRVTNWGEVAAVSVAECALMLVLSSLRGMTRHTLEMHVERKWAGPLARPSRSLSGRSVGIHGMGAVARQLQRFLEPFECNVEFFSDGVPQSVFTERNAVQARSLESLFKCNDVVIEAEAWTPATEHSVTREILLSLKPGSTFINVGRGAVVAPGAIEELACRGDVAIGLDVFEPEPLSSESILRGLRHVTLLPHTAGPTADRYPNCGDFALSNLNNYFQGRRLEATITPEIYNRIS